MGTSAGALPVFWSLAALLGVLALAVLTVRLLAGRLAPGARGRSLRLLEHLPLGREGGLWLVEAGRRRLLLGTAARGVQLLADLTEAAGPPAPGLEAVQPASGGAGESGPAAAGAGFEGAGFEHAGFEHALAGTLARLRRLGSDGDD